MKQYLFVAMFCICFFIYGCSEANNNQKLEDVEFSVVADEDIPEQLKTIIEEKKVAPFQLSYSDGEKMYIAVGYGEQSTGGYSIEVPEVYLTAENIVIDTNLLGPEGTPVGVKSYPYVVIEVEYQELPVLYK